MADDAEWKRNEHAWWEAKEFDHKPHEIMIPHIRGLLQDQTQRYRNFERLNAAYEFGPKLMAWDSRDDKNLEDVTMTFNYAAAAIDTVVSKTVKSAVVPMPLTTGGTYDDRDNAEKLGQALEGEWAKNKVRELFEDVALDGYVLGNGSFYVPHGQGSIEVQFLPDEDVVVDEAECRYRMPRSMYLRFRIDRDKLLEKYGVANDRFYGSITDRRLAIHKAAMVTSVWTQRDRLHNQVEVWAGYHLLSGPDADDGCFAVCIEGATLEFDQEWNRTRFPLATFTPFKRRRHWHGRSMMAELMSPQREHDKVTDRLQMAMHRLGGTHLLINRKANIDEAELDNGQGTRITYDDIAGQDPVKELHPTPANPETFQYREGLVTEMQARFGINSMAMTGAVEEGLQGASGKALELAEEQTAERLIIQQNEKDRVLVDLAWLIIEEAEAIVEDDADYTVNAKVEDGLRKVKWKDALLARDEFTLDVKPAGDLASTPSARFDQLMKMADANRITTDEFRSQWFMPDLKSANDLDLSDSQIIEKLLSKIVKEGKALLPEAFDNLELAEALGRKFYNMCRVKDVPEDRLQLLRDYVSRAKTLNDRAKATAAAQAAANAPQAAPPQGQPPNGAPPGAQPQRAA